MKIVRTFKMLTIQKSLFVALYDDKNNLFAVKTKPRISKKETTSFTISNLNKKKLWDLYIDGKFAYTLKNADQAKIKVDLQRDHSLVLKLK